MNDPLEVKRVSALKMMTPLIIFIVIAVAWSAYWYMARQQAQQTFADFRAETKRLECEQESWGGYPFRITFDCTGMSLPIDTEALSANKLRLLVQPWNTNHVIGALFGPVTFRGMTLDGDAIRFSHRTEDGKLALASLITENQTLTLADQKQFRIAKASAHMRPMQDTTTVEYTAILEQITLEELALDSFKLDGTYDPAAKGPNYLVLLSEASEYLDAIWMVQRLANLKDPEMHAADAIIRPLLKSNNNKLAIQRKNGIWYWGPFPLQK